MPRRGFLILLSLLPFLPSLSFGDTIENYVKNYREVAAPPWRTVKPLLMDFYRQRNYAPAWDKAKGFALLESVGKAAEEGLDPRVYGLDEARAFLDRANDVPLSPQGDVFLTEIFLCYALHLSQGRLDPAQFYPQWRPVRRDVDIIRALNEALETGNFEEIFIRLAPQHPTYHRMKEELRHLRELGGREIPPGNLKEILTAFGDLVPEGGKEELIDAIRRFQWRHGLPPTGRIDRETRKFLNLPWEERIRRLEINMERWRWLPDDFGSRYILTILPDLTLYVVDEGRTVMAMKTVIGTPQQPSPIFCGQLSYLELNPTWNIPPSIVAKEIIPKVIKDPEYLKKKRIRIYRDWNESAPEIPPEKIKWHRINPEKFPYRLTQDPGVNPLGRIKFMFPNEFDVYLHDTTERHLFHRKHRLYSHGCIRIEHPFSLALWLLKDTYLGFPEELKKEIRSRKRQKIELPNPIPVYIIYLTAWVDGNGLLHFRPDYYEYDKMMREALKALPSLSPP